METERWVVGVVSAANYCCRIHGTCVCVCVSLRISVAMLNTMMSYKRRTGKTRPLF